MGGGPRLSVTSAQRLHLKQNHAAMRLCFNSGSLSPRHRISPLLDHHLSGPIRASGSLYLHVVPITPDHEVAIVFGCGGALAPGDAFSSQAWNHLCLYVPCYDSLMVLATVSQWSKGGPGGRRGRQGLIRVQTLLTDLWQCDHRARFIMVKSVWK